MTNEIFAHRSIRKYKPDPVSPEILNKILLAATRASNTGNMQVYSIIVTQDAEMKEKLAPLHFNQPMVKQAPVLLTFCADLHRFTEWCLQRKAEPAYHNFLWLYTATIDATLASQNAALEAEANNLGICYLGTTNYTADKIIEVLKLPKGVIPVTTLVIGYADEQPELTPRLPLDAVVHYETYKPFDSVRIDSIHNEMENSELAKKLIAENGTETFAQIFTQKRYTRAANEKFSEVLLQVIQNQGF
jgi:nitroreductase